MPREETLDCEQMLDELQDVLRGEATPESVVAVERHLDACAPCLTHVKFEERFRALLRGCGGERIPADVRERLLGVLRRDA
ncbi:MAG: zf-HC2 domain-containing protein [Gemmatimonadales bacterium]